jgi:RNA polymerase sigma-70 factor (ECF subfamily)
LPRRHPAQLNDDERLLVEELYPSLRRFASAVRPPGEDGNDLVQEALLRAIRGRGSLTELDHPGAYLRRTILHLAQDHQRSENRRRRAWVRLGAERAEVPAYSWDLEELRLVSPKSRAVLYLRIIEGWPYAEIARTLGCSEVSARKAASRGKRQLRSALVKEADDATA